MSEENGGTLNVDVRELVRPKPDTPVQKLNIVWIDLAEFHYHPIMLAISALPGCKFKETVRDLEQDITQIHQLGFHHVFILCSEEELQISSTPDLIERYTEAGFIVHNYPIEKGMPPDMNTFLEVAEKVKKFLNKREKCLIHCWGCYGRSCVMMASLLLHWKSDYTSTQAIEYMRLLCGPRAIQTIKQFNFLSEFRDLYKKHQEEKSKMEEDEARRVSR